MESVEVRLVDPVAPSAVQDAVRAASRELGLVASLLGGLRTFPGSAHWHLKRGAEAGTIEVTFWPKENRLWLSVQARRTSPWVRQVLPKLRAALARSLKARKGRLPAKGGRPDDR